MIKFLLISLFTILFIPKNLFSQDGTSDFNFIINFPDKVISQIDNEANRVSEKLTQQTDKYLKKFQRQEEKLKRKLWRTDSIRAKEVFGNVKVRYDNFYDELHESQMFVHKQTLDYNGHLDSLITAMQFLKKSPQIAQAGLLKEKIETNLQSFANLKSKLNRTDLIRKQVTQRQQELKTHLQNTPLAKAFQKFNKDVYYYQVQLREYQDVLKDPTKIGVRLLDVVKKVPVFQDFFSRNSELASLFRMPGTGNDVGNNTSTFAGLQTIVDVQNLVQQRIGGVQDAHQYVQRRMSEAKGHLEDLKNKIEQYNSGYYGNSAEDMPDFRVNNQKTKGFIRRIEWGCNLQTTKGNLYFPVTSDMGLSAGYKLNDKSIIGFGASYKIGWGHSWRQIHITHQGVGLRSFVDIKLKGSFWISGGSELNYRKEMGRIEMLRNMNAWQQCALVGICKKYKVGKKIKGNAQLLYDILWVQQQPRTQAVVFRVGYNF